MANNYWLFKSEPKDYSFTDLMNEPNQTAEWDGVRNYQARNFLRDDVKNGDKVLFYHSNVVPPSVIGTAEVVKEGYPDFTAWDPGSKHYDPKSNPENPRWFMVDIKGQTELVRPITLAEIREKPSLQEISLFTRPRLSIHPINQQEWEIILEMSRAPLG